MNVSGTQSRGFWNSPLGAAVGVPLFIAAFAGLLYVLESAGHAAMFAIPAMLLYGAVLVIGVLMYLFGMRPG